MNIIFLAPPLAGKGTQASIISNKYNIPAISFGDLLREEVDKKTKLGNYIYELQTKGLLVDDSIVIEMLKKRLSKSDCSNGYILDGYPRNINQANIYYKLLNEMNKKIDIVIFLNPPFNEIEKRVLGRINCPNCKKTYNENIEFLKPKKQGICDECNSSLVKRSDDNLSSYKKRYDVYIENTLPLVDFYKERNILYEINDTDINSVTSKIIDIIEAKND